MKPTDLCYVAFSKSAGLQQLLRTLRASVRAPLGSPIVRSFLPRAAETSFVQRANPTLLQSLQPPIVGNPIVRGGTAYNPQHYLTSVWQDLRFPAKGKGRGSDIVFKQFREPIVNRLEHMKSAAALAMKPTDLFTVALVKAASRKPFSQPPVQFEDYKQDATAGKSLIDALYKNPNKVTAVDDVANGRSMTVPFGVARAGAGAAAGGLVGNLLTKLITPIPDDMRQDEAEPIRRRRRVGTGVGAVIGALVAARPDLRAAFNQTRESFAL